MSTRATKTYIKQKLKVLEQLGVDVTQEELEHIRSLKTEEAIDNYSRSLIMRPPTSEHYKNNSSYYTISDAANLLLVSRQTIRVWVESGKLTAVMRDSNNRRAGYQIHINDIVDFLKKYPKNRKACCLRYLPEKLIKKIEEDEK